MIEDGVGYTTAIRFFYLSMYDATKYTIEMTV